jgi:hypothetical protein
LPATGGVPVPVDVRSTGAWLYVLYPDRVVRLPGWTPAGRGAGAAPDTGK